MTSSRERGTGPRLRRGASADGGQTGADFDGGAAVGLGGAVLGERAPDFTLRVLHAKRPGHAFDERLSGADHVRTACEDTGRVAEAALDAFNRFGQEASLRDIPAVLLLDQNHAHWGEEAKTGEHRAIAKMPIKMRDLRGALVEAMQKKVS